MITHFKEIKHFQEASLLLLNHLCNSPTFLVFRQMLLVGFPSKLTISHAVQNCAINTTADVKKTKTQKTPFLFNMYQLYIYYINIQLG